MSKYDEALSCFEKVLEFEPNHQTSLFYKGKILSQKGKHDEALIFYDKVLKSDPEHFEALYHKGLTLSILGGLEKAIECFDKILKNMPNQLDAFFNKGFTLALLGKYKESIIIFEKVFEIAPIFRAEPSRTNRHLAEAISIDLEEAFVDYNDVMDRIEQIIKKTIQSVNDYTKENNDVEFTVPNVPELIPRYTYTELVEKMQKAGVKTEWGDDLYPSNLQKIGLDGFYFIKDWPTGPKPFYVKVSKENPKISDSFDLMFGDLELSSGSTRIEKKEELVERMKNKGMKVDAFEYHLGAFDYGVPPHAGCGIGLERLMMALTGTENIRDTTFYPRDVDRLTP
ncbi:MAG: tetratricopeptide repeat protein [Thaumarchaeota archaeon]|nr:tetratricopeptide repeat protein [Nitrososphaerota archaeon]